MSEYWDEPIYADVEREARGDWLRERPPRHRIEDELDDEELAELYEWRRGNR